MPPCTFLLQLAERLVKLRAVGFEEQSGLDLAIFYNAVAHQCSQEACLLFTCHITQNLHEILDIIDLCRILFKHLGMGLETLYRHRLVFRQELALGVFKGGLYTLVLFSLIYVDLDILEHNRDEP